MMVIYKELVQVILLLKNNSQWDQEKGRITLLLWFRMHSMENSKAIIMHNVIALITNAQWDQEKAKIMHNVTTLIMNA